tara:strand:+ start:86 stop:367 length:282 start_codon:yes stop_codon:yes gene_type:complete
MKKLTISVGILLMSLNSYGQDTIKTFTCPDTITISKLQVIEMINTIDDILSWNSNDEEECECTKNGSYKEGWGSNYWLRVMRDELIENLESHE